MDLPILWMLSSEIGHSLRTGASAAEKALPEGIWSYFSQHIEAGVRRQLQVRFSDN